MKEKFIVAFVLYGANIASQYRITPPPSINYFFFLSLNFFKAMAPPAAAKRPNPPMGA
jgi:hypothetical protein